MKKRLISLVLALVLVCGLLPWTAPAARAVGGSCGANTSWTFNTSSGVLTISGSGATNDWTHWDNLPWAVYRTQIKTVIINSGVTRLGDQAFHNCTNITSVSFPSTLTEIGTACFRFDKNITSLNLPSGLKTIRQDAFTYCDGLTSVTIPASVTLIEPGAFTVCRGLQTIQVASGNTVYTSYGDCLYNKSLTVLHQVPAGKSGSFTVPSGVGSIQEYAFGFCENLTDISLPASVSTIGKGCFNHCSSLTQITVPTNVKRIEYFTFYGCSNLVTVSLPSGVTFIGERAFSDCGKLKSFPLPASLKEIGEDAFSYCYALTEITIPANVTTIGPYAFGYCKNLYRFQVNANNTAFSADNYGVLFNKDKTVLVQCPSSKGVNYKVPDTVQTIGEGAFYGCVNLPAVSLPRYLRAISTRAFSGCKKMTSIVLPIDLYEIGPYAFSGCSSLATVSIANRVQSIGANAFQSCSEDLAIFSAKNSLAQEYAYDNGIPFICAMEIENQPVSTQVRLGQTATFQVAAYGPGITYQWLYKKVGESDWSIWDGKTSSTVTCTAGYSNNGCLYHCVLISQVGVLITEDVTLTTLIPPTITAQPQNTAVAKGKTATFKVTASGSGLSYQWQYKKVGESGWTNWAGKTNATVTCTAGVSNNGCQYRCVVKNSHGSVTSSIAVLTTVSNAPKITAQPKNTAVARGATATFRVVATGEALSYQWQYKKVGESSWTNWAGKTAATVTCTAGTSNNGCLYRCVVKNVLGSVTSSTATLTTVDAPVITAQPQNTAVAQGSTATFKVTAAGSGLSYQWQYKKVGESGWTNWSGKTSATVTCTAGTSNNGCQYRCVVKNSKGSVTSGIAKLTTVFNAPKITAQPKNTSVNKGSTATFKVVATGEALSYQWQYKKVGESGWTNWAGKTSATVTCTAGVSNNGCQYRCVVKNAKGSVTSAIAVLTTINP